MSLAGDAAPARLVVLSLHQVTYQTLQVGALRYVFFQRVAQSVEAQGQRVETGRGIRLARVAPHCRHIRLDLQQEERKGQPIRFPSRVVIGASWKT